MMPEKHPKHKAKRKVPLFSAEQKEAIRQEVLGLLQANPELYLSDLKSHLVTKYQVAKQTAYGWLRTWCVG